LAAKRTVLAIEVAIIVFAAIIGILGLSYVCTGELCQLLLLRPFPSIRSVQELHYSSLVLLQGLSQNMA
jgi:hypothetical protein